MESLRRFFDTTTNTLGPNEVEVIAGTSDLARDGHVVEMSGMDMRTFLRSGVILFNHDASVPVGIPNNARVGPDGKLRLGIKFAPDGDSDDADKVRRLVKSGIIRCISIGFTAIDAVPLDPKRPRDGLRIKRSELNEVSVVSIGADTGAVVTARSTVAPAALSLAEDADYRRRQADKHRRIGEMQKPTPTPEHDRRLRRAEAFRLRWPPQP
jgi:HK97 family phage prohead protease